MIRHWTTLAALVEELRPQLDRAAVVECYRSSDGEIGMHIETPAGTLQLVHALQPPLGTIYVQRANPPRNRERIFPMIELSPIETLAIADAERILTLTLDRWLVVFVAIPGARANTIVCERASGLVVATVRQTPGVSVGAQLQLPQSHLPEPMECPRDATVVEVLQRSRILLAEPYAVRLCNAIGIECSRTWGSIGSDRQTHIIARALAYRQQLICNPTPVVARRGDEELFLLDSVLDGEWEIERVPSVEEGIRRRVRTIWRQWSLQRERQRLERRIRAELERVQRTLAAIERDIASAPDAERYDRWGQLLIAHPDRHRRGLTELTIAGWDGSEETIPLDPARTVIENAERYFAAARKIRRGAEYARRRKEDIARRHTVLVAALANLARAETIDAVAAIEGELFPQRAARVAEALPEKLRSRFRQFALPQGYVLLVGKDARSNDELTFRVARPHDVWLHARGVEGAHGIVPLRTRQLPPSEVIEYAAAIVAYYSAARNASYVPVSWTQRKYLRKPKRSGAGVVDLLREWVVFVEPRAPFNTSEAED
ncbi:MAG: NFACT RNA binding domain-containing protein [Chlorobi bacterium]|nr:NFACT RNA binding domain-containing protein [Chlorobiota bacterium]